MKIENVIRAKFRRAIAELNPVIKRKLNTAQIDQVNEAFAIASEVFFDSLDEILNGKEPDFVDALTEDDIEMLIHDYDDAA